MFERLGYLIYLLFHILAILIANVIAIALFLAFSWFILNFFFFGGLGGIF